MLRNTKVLYLLKTINQLEPLSDKCVFQLASRFSISPSNLSLLISIKLNNGGFHEN